MLRFSVFGLVGVSSFMACQLLGRLLYPFGDEPDFTVRAPGVILDQHSLLNPYFWVKGMLGSVNFLSSCNIDSSPFSLWAKIDAISCAEPLGQVFVRLFVSLVISSPILLVCCAARSVRLNASSRPSLLLPRLDAMKIDALTLSLLVPGVTYSLGLLAEEQLVLMLSLLVILVESAWLPTIFLLAAIFSIDLGNGVVVFAFILFVKAYRFAARKFGLRAILLGLSIQSLLALGLGFSSLVVFSDLGLLADKADAIYLSLDGSELVDKYPVYLRPMITFMTAVFMTPAFVKVIPAHLLAGISIFILFRRMMRLGRVNGVGDSLEPNAASKIFYERTVLAECIAVIATVLLFVFLFPTYSNAKYYLFMVPFLLRGFLMVTSRERIFRQLIVLQFLVFGFLALYRI